MKKEITINEKVVIITVDLDTPKREHGGGYSRSMTAERFIEFKAEEDGQEIAIKYYLGVPEQAGRTLWYGPSAKDRLDLKADRMLNLQSQPKNRCRWQ